MALTKKENQVLIDISGFPEIKFVAFREFLRQSHIPLEHKNWGETKQNGTASCHGYFDQDKAEIILDWLKINAPEVFKSPEKKKEESLEVVAS